MVKLEEAQRRALDEVENEAVAEDGRTQVLRPSMLLAFQMVIEMLKASPSWKNGSISAVAGDGFVFHVESSKFGEKPVMQISVSGSMNFGRGDRIKFKAKCFMSSERKLGWIAETGSLEITGAEEVFNFRYAGGPGGAFSAIRR